MYPIVSGKEYDDDIRPTIILIVSITDNFKIETL